MGKCGNRGNEYPMTPDEIEILSTGQTRVPLADPTPGGNPKSNSSLVYPVIHKRWPCHLEEHLAACRPPPKARAANATELSFQNKAGKLRSSHIGHRIRFQSDWSNTWLKACGP